MKKLLLLVSVILVLAILIPSAVLAANGRQNWQLNNVSAGDGKFVMAKKPGPNSGKPVSSVYINNGEYKIWLADQVSQGVTFSSQGAWIINLMTDDTWITSDATCNAVVGDWNVTSSSFTPITARLVPFSSDAGSGGQWVVRYEFQIGNFTIPNGDYLALKIYNSDSSSPSHTIYTGAGNSSMSSPEGDPGYPTPEVATIVLLGLGLAGVGTFIVIKRKKTAVKV